MSRQQMIRAALDRAKERNIQRDEAAMAHDTEPPGQCYEFRQNLKQLYGLFRHNYFVLGHLDATGEFVPDFDMKPVRNGAPYRGPGYHHLNLPTLAGEPVYEFRSGALVPGVLNRQGNFVPESGGTILDIKDYHYRKDPRRIYNLPGSFVRVNK